MSRISSALSSAFGAGAVRLIALVRMEFDSGTLRLWTGNGTLDWNGEEWTGAGGHIAAIDLPTETAEVKASGGSITFAALDPAILALSDTEPYQGRPIQVYFGARDANGAVVVDPDLAYEGTMDSMAEQDEGETATITLSIESRSAANERAASRRWTPEDQATLYPGDKGFDFVASLQDKDYIWGPRA